MTTPKQDGLNGLTNAGLQGHAHHGPIGHPHDLTGRSGSRQRWEITRLRRVSGDPAAWSGTTADGLPVHVSHVQGILRIEIAEPSRAHPGGTRWRDLLVVRPDYIELELDHLRGRDRQPGGDRRSPSATRSERQTVADWFILGECKSDRRMKAPRMNFRRLCAVLDAREENLPHLLRAGVAGGPARVTVTALVEGDPLPGHPLRGERRMEAPRLFPHPGESR
jgi:hypothetical protein